ncbi:DUF378 domain-containing protein [Clostridium cylindrosporum]|uniref:DUF378 domain-containing protein n=1 Tax=Clostridium cylindrosporum DSM 605 TaxID=1121307 RepID=A0A0J8FZR8_CLOCY|nr:DUF378 domain-containing protein [Clostridium cylindrosporum]KMT21056.1 hypothetical protein CLCY_1c02900 [Clostridium cylindrosporum DSM 605]
MRLNGLDWTGIILTIIGGLNWGLIGLFNFNLVSFLFGDNTLLSRIVYILVGIGALILIYTSTKVSSRDDVTECR